MRPSTFCPEGVIPAVLLPFGADQEIDADGYRAHLRDVTAVDGLSGITVNGHSCEIGSLDVDEQRRVLDLSLDEVGDTVPVVAGVYADGSRGAAAIARMAEQRGASALLVFPPQPFILGAQARPDMALAHFRAIADATDLPLICFQYPLASGQGYLLDALVRLVHDVPSVVAIKDWCNDAVLHERHIRTLHGLPRRVAVLTAHSAWLLPSLVLGCDGILSGSGSVIADLHVDIWQAVQAGDLQRAHTVAARIQPLADAFYAHPAVDMHNRMKRALHDRGRLSSAIVRPPLVPITDEEASDLHKAMAEAEEPPEARVQLGPADM